MSEWARGFGEYVVLIAGGVGVALIAALIVLALSRVTFPTLRHLWHRASPLGRFFGALLFLICSINATTKTPTRNTPKRVAVSAASQVVYSSDKTDRVLTVDDFAHGFVQTRIGTNETFDFTPPDKAEICSDWKSFGAAEDWFYLSFADWAFPVGTNKVSRLRVYSNGRVDLQGSGKLLPLATNLGLTPQISQFWHYLTPSNTLQLTWQNVLYNRAAETPISIQAELCPNGTFTYRYDCSSLGSETITNILVGAAFSGKQAGITNVLPVSTTFISYYPLAPEDAENPDRDEDGIPLIDELFVYETDPNAADTDFDGLSDYDEIAIGTNPCLRDTDGDGIVDGSDPEPTKSTSLDDFDGDGIPDAYESYWFGSTNVVDSLTDYSKNGFSLSFLLSSGESPTNAANQAFMSTNHIVAWKITDGFVARMDEAVSNLYERTFRISRNGGWEQFFISSKPDRAGGWSLEGCVLDWEDSNGTSGSANASPPADSLYLPLSTNNSTTLTLRLRWTEEAIACRSPLYLLAYSPGVEIADAMKISTSNGIWSVVETRTQETIRVTVDRSERPCRATLYPEEDAAELQSEGNKLLLQADGTLKINAPGVYSLPTMGLSAYTRPILRQVCLRSLTNSSSETNRQYLVCCNASVSYGSGHYFSRKGLEYDSEAATYSETYEYPLDSGCLWRAWHSDLLGGYVCDCKPEISVGFDISMYPDISTNLTVNGKTATGSVLIGGVEVWSGSATHDISTESGGGQELLTSDECDECSSCEDGNCDGLEGADLGSLKFRIPLGIPRKGQVSGFAWLLTNEPLKIAVDTLQVLSRRDAQTVDTTSDSSRTIVCRDNRGRTLFIQSITDGVEVTVVDTATGVLEHTWRILNINGLTSYIRLCKISRLGNTMSDETFVYNEGSWTKLNNVSQTSDELVETNDINENGTKREERILRDANNAILSHTVIESKRFGSFENAVMRETYHAEKSWRGNWNESFASYYIDNDYPKRNGNTRLIWGNACAWKFCAYDTKGRVTLSLCQYEGSECPTNSLLHIEASYFDDKDIFAWLQAQTLTAIATISDYVPLMDDDANSSDVNKARTESRYLVRDGNITLIGRTWTRYTHGVKNGYETVTKETIIAGAQDATIFDVRNARHIVTRYDSDATGIPLVLRGAVLSSTSEDGNVEQSSYSITNNILTRITRKTYASKQLPIATVSECCTTYGKVLREWNIHIASDKVFDEKQYFYDDKNRLVSTRYADGSFTTNAYSCCRLLYSIDRNGRKTLRSAVTGQDHLYYAMEEVYLADLPHDNRYVPYEMFASDYNAYRVTQHFMDALGRETNIIVRTCKTVGVATNATWSCRGWRTSATSEYPYGVSDYEIATDVRGNQKATIHTAFANRDVIETIETNKTTTVTTFRNGSFVLREEWKDGKWRQKKQTQAYTNNGGLIETTILTTSDHDTVMESTVYRDFLGRTIREVRPTADVTYTYDGTSSRVITATDAMSNQTIMYLYNEYGEAVGQTKNGVISYNDIGYELESNILWQVSTYSVASSITNLCVVTKERLTELSNEMRNETFVFQNGAPSIHTYASFDETNNVLIEVKDSATTGMTTIKTKYGKAIETSASAGTSANFFDPYGRIFYSENNGRSIEWIGRNNYGDVVEYDTFHASDNVYAEFYGYDNFGNRITTTNTLGVATTFAYDVVNRLTESRGAVHPVRQEYDTEGHKISLSTTRNGSVWDKTRWTFDAASGHCITKTYADNSANAYTYTADGKPLRTTCASGRWCENTYNEKRELASVEYSDGEICSFDYDEFSQEALSSNAVATVQFLRDNYGYITNEVFMIGSETETIERDFDAFGRLVNNADAIYEYAADGLVSTISSPFANVKYHYTADRLDAGYTLTLSNGLVFTHSTSRDPYRRKLICGITNVVNGLVIDGLSYDYDALSRPTCRNSDVFDYNERNELMMACVSETQSHYDYDEIGNLKSYLSNCLNQYTTFPYDADGNLLADEAFSYTYDAANRLKTVSTNGILVLTNFYDAKSRRVKKITPNATTTFIYDDWNLVEERISYTNGTTSMVRYFWGKDLSGDSQGAGGIGGLLYLTIDGTVYIPCYDNMGNIMRYLDADGNTVAQYTYDAFGDCMFKSGALADIFHHRFTTKYFDAETDLYYYGYRFYHPTLKRWLTRDPIEEEGGINLYAFCDNCPVMNVDSFGKDIYLYTGNDSGNPFNDALHQTVVVDTWSNDCPPKKTGVRGFSFGFCGEWGWNWPNGEWLGQVSISLPGYWMIGEIYEASVVGKVVKTKKTTPKQDKVWLKNMESRVGTKDVYSVGRHNCRAFSQAEFDKVQQKED